MTDFETIANRLDILQKKDILSKQEVAYLKTPKNIEKTFVQWETENGTNEAPAYRVLFNDDRGPGKGGIRYHPEVSLNEVKSLAFWMALKTSLVNIPFGGAKGGVSIHPKQLSSKQLTEISRSFVRNLYDVLGPDKDIPAPDVYTNPAIMAVMLDEYESLEGKHVPSFITGKPQAVGGSKGRDTATARGAFFITKELYASGTVAIQGFGNAGYHYARYLVEEGYTVVAVSDSQGAIYNQNGISIEAVKQAKDEHGSVIDAQEEEISNEELLALNVDVLVPAALDNVITEANAEHVQADTILEVANGPVSPDADRILEDNDITVIPDILANSGGVIVSYFEWVQNRSGDMWSHEKVDQKLREIITEAWSEVKQVQEEYDVNLRQSAYIIASRRILRAARLRKRI